MEARMEADASRAQADLCRDMARQAGATFDLLSSPELEHPVHARRQRKVGPIAFRQKAERRARVVAMVRVDDDKADFFLVDEEGDLYIARDLMDRRNAGIAGQECAQKGFTSLSGRASPGRPWRSGDEALAESARSLCEEDEIYNLSGAQIEALSRVLGDTLKSVPQSPDTETPSRPRRPKI